MTKTEIQTWYDFSLLQMAAECYLDGIDLTNAGQIRTRLHDGNNDRRNQYIASLPDDKLPGQTRLTDSQITYLTNNYEIIDHHANDSSGFSATLFRNKATGEYTLSFRSTEYRNPDQGGDWPRDGAAALHPGADGEIVAAGFAFGQIAAMEDYYRRLKASGTLPAGAINVTGYSLGGHLATVFTELHANEVNHTYTFNGAGHGLISPWGSAGASAQQRLAAMMARFTQILFAPASAALTNPDSPDFGLYSNALARAAADPDWHPFACGPANLYLDARCQWALKAIQNEYPSARSDSVNSVGDALIDTKITQLYGHADTDDQEYVANSGIHGPQHRVFIEDQPDLSGFGGVFGLEGDYGTTHSITLINDSLAVMNLFQSVDATQAANDAFARAAA